MSRYSRIDAIIELLKQGPQTIESIINHFAEKVSPRQIRSDIELIRASGYGDAPDFEQTGRANRKTWQIRASDYERNTLWLAQGILPQVFNVKRNQVLEKLTNWPVSESGAVIESTHFYETVAKEHLDNNLEIIIRSIDTNRKIQLVAMNGDATSVVPLVEFPILVLPIKVLYHRGCFYLAAVTNTTHQVLTFQIDQLILEKLPESFQRTNWTNVVETDLKNRFGVTQNIDNQIYKIELQFSDVTGGFIQQQFWHDEYAAKFDGNDWLITFHCGINRELVGWIFQWMSNVKIIGPPELKDLYNEQLTRMLSIASQPSTEPIAYSNLFAPAAL